MELSISVVIATHNRKNLLKKCLESLSYQTFPNEYYEVIVVDDGSFDGTDNIIDEFLKIKSLKLTYLRQKNLGPAIARNKGIKISKGRIILFLDDDCIADDNLLTTIAKHFCSNYSDRVAGIKGKEIPIYDEENVLPYLLGKYIYKSNESLATNNIAYRKNVLIEVNLFDESFPVPAWEDVDLGIRIKDKGYKIIYDEKAVVFHPFEDNINLYQKKCYINGIGLSFFFKKWLFKKPLRALYAIFNDSRHIIYYPFVRKQYKKSDFNEKALRGIRAYYTIRGFIKGILLKSKPLSKDTNI